MSEDTALLAREAQLMYSNVSGWQMHGGSLRTWRGKLNSIEFEAFLPRMFPNVPPVLRALTPVRHPNIDSDGIVSLRIMDNWRVEFHLYQVVFQLISLLKHQPAQLVGRPSQSKNSSSSQSRRQAPQPNWNQSESESETRPLTSVPPAARTIPSPNSYNNQTSTSESQNITMQELSGLRKEIERMKTELHRRDEELTHIRAKEAIGVKNTTHDNKGATTDDLIAQLEAEQIAISELMTNLDDKHATGESTTIEYAKLYKKYSQDLFILKKKIDYVKAKGKLPE